MKKYNIFQGNNQLQSVVKTALEYNQKQEYSRFTEDIYLSTFFYLINRFGYQKPHDDYKQSGVWTFEVKNYTIRIELDSNNVNFIVFGEYRLINQLTNNPYSVKRRREELRKKDLLVDMSSGASKPKSTIIIDELFEKFCTEHKIDDSWDQERFEKEKGMHWFNYISDYNLKVIGLDLEEIINKYGHEYSNSGTRHALKTLRQFLNNMLTPIWIRDCAYNIKGRISNEKANEMTRYENNININLK